MNLKELKNTNLPTNFKLCLTPVSHMDIDIRSRDFVGRMTNLQNTLKHYGCPNEDVAEVTEIYDKLQTAVADAKKRLEALQEKYSV